MQGDRTIGCTHRAPTRHETTILESKLQQAPGGTQRQSRETPSIPWVHRAVVHDTISQRPLAKAKRDDPVSLWHQCAAFTTRDWTDTICPPSCPLMLYVSANWPPVPRRKRPSVDIIRLASTQQSTRLPEGLRRGGIKERTKHDCTKL